MGIPPIKSGIMPPWLGVLRKHSVSSRSSNYSLAPTRVDTAQQSWPDTSDVIEQARQIALALQLEPGSAPRAELGA